MNDHSAITETLLAHGYSDSFKDHAKSLRITGERRDFDDLNNAMSGVETGRNRFRDMFYKWANAGYQGGRSAADIIFQTLEWLLLTNPQYRQAHETLITSVRSAQQVAQTALERVMQALAHERPVMDALLSSAATLPDGTKVFKDKSGKIRNLDGEIISDELAATIQWTGNEPSYEDYLVQKQRIEKLETAERELRGIETELGEIDERANRNAAPLSKEGIGAATEHVKALKERVEEIQTNVLEKLEAEPQRKIGAEAETFQAQSPQNASIPKINLGTVR